ncbi:glycosyltransferase [Thermomicrobiaceae bacterium CFH 74404]|uniref:Glycosyltransferase n=1 Tax=Thermalbibacter longus TaxID=2951981 RepID=A0AA41WEZ5_9BACT|nr:glycosyltransferase [Thermalbibacter longus]MCM8748191.1 glycosyltransferase [Thermalbibacter longus]
MRSLDSRNPGSVAEPESELGCPAVSLPELVPVSVIVPTLNEADNIEPLLARLERVLPAGSEIIFVDDSDDETPAVIRSIQQQARHPIRLYHRLPHQRAGGLGGAVVAGLRVARSPWACVLDADLQHPPELIPCLLEEAMRTGADIAIASRYRSSSEDVGGLTRLRAAVSRALVTATRLLFWRRLREVTDPLSGFFLVRTAAVNCQSLRPRGFKILLEILVRHPHLRTVEVSFQLDRRHAGRSKASLREGMRYLVHLTALRLSRPYSGTAARGWESEASRELQVPSARRWSGEHEELGD